MDHTFLAKLIAQVSKSYTHGETLPLTNEEEQQLIHTIREQQRAEPTSDLIDIIHDVVYRFFTDQPD
ncbi:YqzH family protein [Halalkalibacter urbisdiaboli]|uniref:YqzH family protein n=1 Tax=Halalkalibacter urbisdiaboli TaxID=1960589 RepID=UPI000B43F871|nr:YqzH family protein [Halalkalibacter urbisdiaboli]